MSVAPNIPTYKEVMRRSRHINRFVIEPFERDMDALKDTLTWTYCHSNNSPLSDKELKTMSYELFNELLVKINWNKYPNRTIKIKKELKNQKTSKKIDKKSGS